MILATRVATTTVTHGATTSIKMTGKCFLFFFRSKQCALFYLLPVFSACCSVFLFITLHCHCLGPTPGPMHPNHSRAGDPTVATEAKAGVVAGTAPEEEATTTGASPKKVLGRWAGTATATGPALDVGASQVEPTPAAATPGLEAEGQILQTRARQTQAPTGETRSTSPILRVTARAGESQRRTTMEPRTGASPTPSPPTSGAKVLNLTCPEAIKGLTSPQVIIRERYHCKINVSNRMYCLSTSLHISEQHRILALD